MFTQTGTTANLLFPFSSSLHSHTPHASSSSKTHLPPFEIFIPPLLHLDRSKDGRVVQGGSFRYYSLRRRGFEPHSLHFLFWLPIRLPSNSSTCVSFKTDSCLLYTFAPSLSRDSVAEWSKACDSKSLLLWRRRFESCRCRFFFFSFSSNSNALSLHSTRLTVWPSGLRRLT